MVQFEHADDLWPEIKKFRRETSSELLLEKKAGSALARNQTNAASAIVLNRDWACLERLVKIMETK